MDQAVEPSGRMTPYGPEHLAVLALTVMLTVVMVHVARRIRGTDIEDRILATFGWIMLWATVFWTVWGLTPGQWNIEQSLPFHFSDALRFITGIALITRAGWAIAICFYWGLTLNLQSIITPDLNYFELPAMEFTQYWFFHIAVFVVPIVFVWGLGYQPTWRGFGVAYTGAVIWAWVAFTANSITGANYAYLSRGPEGASILDLLGPWPIYIVWEAVIIAVVWALMTLPFETQTARTGALPNRAGTLRRRMPVPNSISALGQRPRQPRAFARQEAAGPSGLSQRSQQPDQASPPAR